MIAVALIAGGLALAAYGFSPSRRAPGPQARSLNRARARFLWDVCVDMPFRVLLLALFVLAPRHVSPGARIPRQQVRRMVNPMTPTEARRRVNGKR